MQPRLHERRQAWIRPGVAQERGGRVAGGEREPVTGQPGRADRAVVRGEADQREDEERAEVAHREDASAAHDGTGRVVDGSGAVPSTTRCAHSSGRSRAT